MDAGRLNHRASVGGKPTEAFGDRQFSDGSGIFTGDTDALKGLNVIIQVREIQFVTQYVKTLFIDLRTALKKFL